MICQIQCDYLEPHIGSFQRADAHSPVHAVSTLPPFNTTRYGKYTMVVTIVLYSTFFAGLEIECAEQKKGMQKLVNKHSETVTCSHDESEGNPRAIRVSVPLLRPQIRIRRIKIEEVK